MCEVCSQVASLLVGLSLFVCWSFFSLLLGLFVGWGFLVGWLVCFVFRFNPVGFQLQLLNLSICQWCDKFSLVIREQLPIAKARMAFGLPPAVQELAVSRNAQCTQWKKTSLLANLLLLSPV